MPALPSRSIFKRDLGKRLWQAWRGIMSVSAVSGNFGKLNSTHEQLPTSGRRSLSSSASPQFERPVRRPTGLFGAYSQLQSSGQGPSANSNTPLAQALNQIGQDLHNDDVTSARQTLASLQQARGGHHHNGHHAHGADPFLSSQTTTTTLLQGDTSSSSPNSINIAV